MVVVLIDSKLIFVFACPEFSIYFPIFGRLLLNFEGWRFFGMVASGNDPVENSRKNAATLDCLASKDVF